MSDRLQEIRARLDAWHGTDPVEQSLTHPDEFVADIAWLLDEIERLRDIQERNMPWWRRDADGSLWAAPPTVDGAPEPDSDKWVRVQ